MEKMIVTVVGINLFYILYYSLLIYIYSFTSGSWMLMQALILRFYCSVQFSHSVVSDSLRPHGLQHAGLPCPSLTPGRFYYQKFICGFQIDTFRLLILFKLVDLLIQFLTKSLDNSHFNLDFYLEKIISYKCFYIKGKFSLHKCKINNYSFSCLMYYNKLHCQGAEKSNHSVEGRHSSQASHSRQGRQSCQPRVCRSTAV